MSTSAFFGLITITTGYNVIYISGHMITIPVGNYYIYHPTNSRSLLDTIVDLTVATGQNLSYSFNTTTGKITFATTGPLQLMLNWYGSGIGTLLGYSQDFYSGYDTYTAEKAPMYSWIPGWGPTDSTAHYTRGGIAVEDISQAVSEDGLSISTAHYGQHWVNDLSFKYVSSSKVWESITPDNSSFEEFWDTVIKIGQYFVHVVDFTGNGSETYSFVYKANLENMKEFKPTRTTQGKDSIWNITLNLYWIND